MFFFSFKECPPFPDVKNGRKEVIRSDKVNETHSLEVSVRYVCRKWLFYTLPNPTLSCVDGGYDNEVGKCVQGEIFIVGYK